jgi:hypothetical protein
MIHVEDYIGGFLLKNRYCTFPSLGTLDLKKRSASYDGENLDAPEYQLIFTPVGIIDDAFPTYIADNENVSIAKASNEIRDFSQKVKASLQKSGRYEIDLIGSFLLKDETVIFKQSSDLNLGYTPVKADPITEDYEENKETPKVDTGNFKNLEYTHADSAVSKPKNSVIIKYLLALLLLVGLAAAAYFGYNFIKDQNANKAANEEASIVSEPEEISLTENDTTYNGDEALAIDAAAADAATADTTTTVANAVTDSPAPAIQGNEVNIAVTAYPDKSIAESKSKKLNSYGNKTSVMTIDGKVWLVITASHPTNDITALKDSLRRFFNPSGTPFVVK